MTPDPKVGWHALWIAPCLWIATVIGTVVDWPITKVKEIIAKIKHERQLKKWRSNPVTARLRKLSGQDK